MAEASGRGLLDIFWWKVVPERWGGGRPHIQAYKDDWVRFNKLTILSEAAKNRLRPNCSPACAGSKSGATRLSSTGWRSTSLPSTGPVPTGSTST